MKKLHLLISILIGFNSSNAQTVTVSTDKEIYKKNDAVQIKIINKISRSQAYVVALEININNRWDELEADINMLGNKVEIMKKIKKNQVIIKKLILPNYIIRIITPETNKFRFRIKYGQSYESAAQTYSNIFKIDP